MAGDIIAWVGSCLDSDGLVSATDGNVSLRGSAYPFLYSPNCMLITPSGSRLVDCQQEDLCAINIVTGYTSYVNPSSESPTHLAIYQERSDVNAIIHAHPDHATVLYSGFVPPPNNVEVVEYSDDPDATAFHVQNACNMCETIILKNHGAITFGESIEEALSNMQFLERDAYQQFVAHMMAK